MANKIKGLVSKNKRRYQADGFDLDLSYILPNVIAMGFPAEKLEGVYRNHIDDVVRFLEKMHRGKYRIYNLCSERAYDKSKFHGCVQDFPFDDHHPPSFDVIRCFCSDVDNWLKQEASHVAVVHCKAGKGRTGVMICAYLLHSGLSTSPQSALQLYSTARTMDEKGVTIPSQRRYVFYYSEFLQSPRTYHPVKLMLHALRLEPLPPCINGVPVYVVRSTTEPQSVSCDRRKRRQHTHWSEVTNCPRIKKSDDQRASSLLLTLKRPILVVGDVIVEFYNKPKMMKKEKLFHFWFNTFFVTQQEECQLENGGISDGVIRSYSADDVTKNDVTKNAAVVDAHRQREQLQTQVMDGLKRIELHTYSDGNDSSLERNDIHRSSWRCREKIRERHLPAPQYLNDAVNSRSVYRTLSFDKTELDKANKDKQHKLFPADFKVKLYMTSPGDDMQSQNNSVCAVTPSDGAGLLTPENADVSGTAAQLSDFDDDTTDADDDLSETDDDDDLWTSISAVLQQTRV